LLRIRGMSGKGIHDGDSVDHLKYER
jgi:hypothetical protein